MEVKILEGEVNQYDEANAIVLSFGKIKENSPAKIKIKVEGVEDSSLEITCGCTGTTSEEKNVFEIGYKDTNSIHTFSKVLILNYIEGGEKKQKQIKITGQVIK